MRKRGSYKVEVGTWTCPPCQHVHKPADLLRKDADNLTCRGCGLATNLHELRVEDIVIAAILRHGDVSVTRRAYIKNSGVDPRSLEAMRKFSGALAELPVQ